MPTTFTEGRHPGEVILSEANFSRSRGVVTIPSGTGIVAAGTVLGEVTASPGEFVPSPNAETVDIEGAETATCVNIYEVDATDADVQVAVIERDAELVGPCLVYDSSVDDNTKIAAKATQLAAVGLIVR